MSAPGGSSDADSGPADTLVASIRAEPRSFNRYTARDLTTDRPDVPDAWGVGPRQSRHQRASNPSWPIGGATARSANVPSVASAEPSIFRRHAVHRGRCRLLFRAIYDRAVASILADTLQVHGQPLSVTAEDATTVVIRFPSPFGPGLRMLDGVPNLPRHRLEAALAAGSFRSAWGPATPAVEMAGLGPFILRRYEPGSDHVRSQPYYWQRESRAAASSHLVLEVVRRPGRRAASARKRQHRCDAKRTQAVRCPRVEASRRRGPRDRH